VASWLELVQIILALELDKGREQQDHVTTLIHDRRVAERAANLARKLMLDRLLRWVVPFEIVVAVCEVDVRLLEDGSPLEGCGWTGLLDRVREFAGGCLFIPCCV